MRLIRRKVGEVIHIAPTAKVTTLFSPSASLRPIVVHILEAANKEVCVGIEMDEHWLIHHIEPQE